MCTGGGASESAPMSDNLDCIQIKRSGALCTASQYSTASLENYSLKAEIDCSHSDTASPRKVEDGHGALRITEAQVETLL